MGDSNKNFFFIIIFKCERVNNKSILQLNTNKNDSGSHLPCGPSDQTAGPLVSFTIESGPPRGLP